MSTPLFPVITDEQFDRGCEALFRHFFARLFGFHAALEPTEALITHRRAQIPVKFGHAAFLPPLPIIYDPTTPAPLPPSMQRPFSPEELLMVDAARAKPGMTGAQLAEAAGVEPSMCNVLASAMKKAGVFKKGNGFTLEELYA